MTKAELIDAFDPNGVAVNEGIFGLPFELEHAEVVVFPVSWDITVSYRDGTSYGPAAIKEASYQVDLLDPYVKNAWKMGIYMTPLSNSISYKSERYRETAIKYINALEKGTSHLFEKTLQKINAQSQWLNNRVYEKTNSLLQQDKLVLLLGGDHSTPFGYIKALSEKHKSFSILQIDAHADLRKAYENFTFSHASIMYNVIENFENVTLTQVGIRDYCEEEEKYAQENKRITTYYDKRIKQDQYAGRTWQNQVEEIITSLDQKVYLSFDIDGLDPKLCPNTGTPVAGGFEVEQILYLLEKIIESGKTIIGGDLCEVAPGNDDWDANVGARLLYKLCNILGKSNERI